MHPALIADTALALDRWLIEYRPFWSPQPFKGQPPWCDSHPDLYRQLAALQDHQLESLLADSQACRRLLAPYLPGINRAESWLQLAALPRHALGSIPATLQSRIPGRKWHQITAFARTIKPVGKPVLEWCSGKGHLGRLLSHYWKVDVRSVDHDHELCRQGRRLAHRVAVRQSFQCGDVYQWDKPDTMTACHAVALHACGGLHRHLVQQAVAAQCSAIDLVPCCYFDGVSDRYRTFNPELRLLLNRDDVRLSVTETATASAKAIANRDREATWKMAYAQLRQDITGKPPDTGLGGAPNAWLRLSLEDYCRHFARKDGLSIAGPIHWRHYETQARLRQKIFMRLCVARFAFRRALEYWLVLDMAWYLSRHGYDVSLGTFCRQSVSPRNVLLSARAALS